MPRKPKEAGLEAARLYCQWHIGDRYWADLVLEAYLNPDDRQDEGASCTSDRRGLTQPVALW